MTDDTEPPTVDELRERLDAADRAFQSLTDQAPVTALQVSHKIPISRLLELRHALTVRDMDARIVAGLKARGEYDSEEHGVLDKAPLSVQEHLSVLAYGAVIARHVLHPSDVDHAVRAGATWSQIAEALDREEWEVRRDYVRWANGQRHLGEQYEDDPDGVMLGMTEAEHAEALELACLPTDKPQRTRTTTSELRAGDLEPGTGFEVTVLDDGTFHVVVFYSWPSTEAHDGEGGGATFTEAASRAIADAEGEEHALGSLADNHRTGDLS